MVFEPNGISSHKRGVDELYLPIKERRKKKEERERESH